jgi:hypothetical protein
LGEERREEYICCLSVSGFIYCTEVEVEVFVDVTKFDNTSRFVDIDPP